MLRRHALCVGIDHYPYIPGANLMGCVNDANAMAALLRDLMGFQDSDITRLTDASATKQNILEALDRMVEGALAGRYDHLVFSFSGQGTQVPDLDLDEWDRADDAYCPHDARVRGLDWDRDHLIVDHELHDRLVKLPATVLLELYLDTSHAPRSHAALAMQMERNPRYLPPPSPEAVRELAFRRARPTHQKLLEKGLSHHVLWTACREGETAAEALLDGAWHGAFTWHFCREARISANHLSRAKVLARVRSDLTEARFQQMPQLDCEAVTRHAVLKAAAVPPNVLPLYTDMPS